MSKAMMTPAVSSRLSDAECVQLEKNRPLPQRPGTGSVGKGIKLVANYYQVTKLPVGEIIQYDVSITPDVPRAVKRKIFGIVEGNFGSSAFGGKGVAYDGQANLYSLGPLPKSEITLEVSLAPKSERPDDRSFQVKIRQVSSVNLATLDQFLSGKLSYTPFDVITALEVIMRHPLTQGNVVVGRSLYSGRSVEPISGGLEVWKGIFASLRPSPGRLLLNADTTATAFYSPGPVLDIIRRVLNIRGNEVIGRLNEQEVGRVERLLRGVRVEVSHRGATFKRKYKILGLTSSPCAETFFDMEAEGGTGKGKKVSVAAYFEEKYGKKISEPGVPCLVVGSPERSVFLPCEVASIPAGQRCPRKLDEEQTSDMIKIANQKPSARFQTIRAGAGALLDDAQVRAGHESFQLSIGRDLLSVQGRVLSPPKLFYHASSRESEIIPHQGAWNLKDKRVETGVNVQSWAVVVLGRASESEVRAFLQELVTTCQDTGITFTPAARQPPIITAGASGVAPACKQAFDRAATTFATPPQFMLVMLPSAEAFTYGQVKLCGDTQLNIPTQCMLLKHARRPNKQYCANLCLKINLKLGGTNVSLGRQLAFVTARPTMVMGADVTHPGIGEMDKPSIAAVVASQDIKMARYGAAVRVQGARQEIIADLAGMTQEHLASFLAANKRLPERILFYRDGVSEGQYAQVLNEEVRALKAGCEAFKPGYAPTLTMVIVQKRHHTRFMVANAQDADRSGNIPAGTVVDTAVCHPTLFDFFLCSHGGIQGTSRPTHYHVIYDDHKFSPDDMQTLSYNLCYTFGRCTRSVSVVTPAYYAHLVAFRARFHFNDKKKFMPVSQQLSRDMYFI
jgi:hypothetical protein